MPTPTTSNHIANKGYVESWIKKDGSGNIDAENKKIMNLALTPSADHDVVSFGFLNLYLPRIVMEIFRVTTTCKPKGYVH